VVEVEENPTKKNGRNSAVKQIKNQSGRRRQDPSCKLSDEKDEISLHICQLS
jgi:hypothetical protein